MSQESYSLNRARVFEIYGIDPKNKNYNCHHVCFRSDLGNLLPEDFNINEKSNLYPILVRDHDATHAKVHRDEKGMAQQRIKYGLRKEPKPQSESRKIRKQELKNTVNRYNLDSLDINLDLHQRVTNKAGKRRNSKHR